MNFLNSTYRLIALTMALLMFFTSTGFVMDMHYCGGKLKSFSFFGKAKTCYDMVENDETTIMGCIHHQEVTSNKEDRLKKKNCCSNKTLHLQSNQTQQVQTTDFIVNNQLKQFITTYVIVFFPKDHNNSSKESVAFTRYKPPLIPKDIPVFHQAFLL